MRCSHCGVEIASNRKSDTMHGERDGVARSNRRLFSRILLAVFSSGWVVMAAISEFWHAGYISKIHNTGFSQQTPEFFQMLDITYRSQNMFYFMGACLWLTLVLLVWAWKLATHLERSKALAESLRARSPAGDP
jgi:hypothetical protein